jgi:hypothetical protein
MTAGPVADDPFWRTFHAEHPEVDLVLLPDPTRTARSEDAPAADAPAVEPATLEQVEAVADSLLDELDDHLTGRPGWPAVVPRTQVRRQDPLRRRYLECRIVVNDLTPDRTVPLLRSVGNAFLASGWRARPVPGERPRLVARRGPFTATAAVTPDSLQLILRSGLLPAEGAPR